MHGYCIFVVFLQCWILVVGKMGVDMGFPGQHRPTGGLPIEMWEH